jgi:hypothetical protein
MANQNPEDITARLQAGTSALGSRTFGVGPSLNDNAPSDADDEASALRDPPVPQLRRGYLFLVSLLALGIFITVGVIWFVMSGSAASFSSLERLLLAICFIAIWVLAYGALMAVAVDDLLPQGTRNSRVD